MSDLTPQHVLADLFGGEDFPAEILDPERAAEIVIQRLITSPEMQMPRPGRARKP
jgi:hypothetical protein